MQIVEVLILCLDDLKKDEIPLLNAYCADSDARSFVNNVTEKTICIHMQKKHIH